MALKTKKSLKGSKTAKQAKTTGTKVKAGKVATKSTKKRAAKTKTQAKRKYSGFTYASKQDDGLKARQIKEACAFNARGNDIVVADATHKANCDKNTIVRAKYGIAKLQAKIDNAHAKDVVKFKANCKVRFLCGEKGGKALAGTFPAMGKESDRLGTGFESYLVVKTKAGIINAEQLNAKCKQSQAIAEIV